MEANELSSVDYAYVDFSAPESILAHAKKLEGHSFREILDLGIVPEGVDREYNNKRYKGGMGTLIEERYFGYKANSDERADFPEAGVELKTTCFDLRKDGSPKAGERLVLTMIPFDRAIEDELQESHLWEKAGKILLIYYGRNREIDGYDQVIEHVILFTPPASDMAIIEEDYRTIRDLVQAGRAEELSEGLTQYLGACTKGANAEKLWADQFYPSQNQAKRRAFCFKQPYMNYVLNHYILGNEGDAESIVKDPAVLKKNTFEEYVLSLVSPHVGKTDRQLCDEFGLEYTGNKAQWTQISYHMLGISSERAEEFEKANVSVRTVRLEENGNVVRESLSLDTFSFEDVANEDEWEESALYRYFDETKFFFVVFQKKGNESVFRGARFWVMPKSDIAGPLRKCWEKLREKVKSGVSFLKTVTSTGRVVVKNDLPKKTENPVAHVRPHTSKAAYLLSDGTELGDIEKHADKLPDGQWMTKQSFWLNSDYVYGIVKDI